ncbi:MAG: hypothetical protein SFU83_01875 [Meiothermus sp.]|nr:hypothetical protein [Meiothermus sp.]
MKKLFLLLAISALAPALAQTNSWSAAVSADYTRTVMTDLTAGLSATLIAPLSSGAAASLTLEPNWRWTFARFGVDDFSGDLFVGQNAPLTLAQTSSLSLTSRFGLNLGYNLLTGLYLRSLSEARYTFGVANVGISAVSTSPYLYSDLRLEYGSGNYSLGAGAEFTFQPNARTNYFAKASYDATRQLNLSARYDTNFQGFNLSLTSLYRITGDTNLEGLLETSNSGGIRARVKLGLSF